MDKITQKITPFLWYKDKAEEAAKFYVSVFSKMYPNDSKIGKTTYYDEASSEAGGRPNGSVMTVPFTLAGQEFVAINGGEPFKLSEATSFVINVSDQKELDYYWDKLTEGGDEKAQICGWLKDKFGLSWQVVPVALGEMLSDPDPKKAEKVMQAMLQMKKIDLGELKKAYA